MEASSGIRAPPPGWIDQSFIEAALNASSPSNRLSLASISVEHATTQGAGYGSQMYRVKVTIRNSNEEATEQRSLVIKTAITEGTMKKLTEKGQIFETESLALGDVVPAVHAALLRLEGAAFRPLAASCLRCGMQPAPFLVLEDLVAAGFRLADAGCPLDYEHCRLAICNYARLHAASVQLLSVRPDYRQRLCKDLLAAEESREMLQQTLATMLCAAADFMNRTPGYEHYAQKYEALASTIMQRVKEALAHARKETKLTVLVHGDSWKNNMMYKYLEGRVTEIRFVDFQLMHTSSPARDLQFFLYANAALDVHEQRMEELLGVYHSQLQDSLRALGQGDAADRYPLTELRRDLDDLDDLALFGAAISGIVLTAERFGDRLALAVRDMSFDRKLLHGTFDNGYSLPYMMYISRLFESKGLL